MGVFNLWILRGIFGVWIIANEYTRCIGFGNIVSQQARVEGSEFFFGFRFIVEGLRFRVRIEGLGCCFQAVALTTQSFGSGCMVQSHCIGLRI